MYVRVCMYVYIYIYMFDHVQFNSSADQFRQHLVQAERHKASLGLRKLVTGVLKLYIYIYIYICVCIHTYTHIYMHVCVYIYIYTYIYIYIYILYSLNTY